MRGPGKCELALAAARGRSTATTAIAPSSETITTLNATSFALTFPTSESRTTRRTIAPAHTAPTAIGVQLTAAMQRSDDDRPDRGVEPLAGELVDRRDAPHRHERDDQPMRLIAHPRTGAAQGHMGDLTWPRPARRRRRASWSGARRASRGTAHGRCRTPRGRAPTPATRRPRGARGRAGRSCPRRRVRPSSPAGTTSTAHARACRARRSGQLREGAGTRAGTACR